MTMDFNGYYMIKPVSDGLVMYPKILFQNHQECGKQPSKPRVMSPLNNEPDWRASPFIMAE